MNLGSLQLGLDGHGRTIAQALAEQMRFVVTSAGVAGTPARRVLPQTSSAREWLQTPAGRRGAGMMATLAAEADVAVRPDAIRQFSISDGLEGLVLGLHHAQHPRELAELLADPELVGRAARDQASRLRYQAAQLEDTLAIYQSGTVILGPKAAESFRHFAAGGGGVDDAERATRLAYVLTHEMFHGASRPEALTAGTMWIEEAATDMAARVPGRILRTGKLLGLPVQDVGERTWWDIKGGYRASVVALRGVAELAGVDTYATSRAGREAIVQAVRGTRADELPGVLAERIVRRFRLDPSQVAPLTEDIIASGGRPTTLLASLRRYGLPGTMDFG